MPADELVQSAAGLDGCCGVPPANPALNGLRLSLAVDVAVPKDDVSPTTTAYLVPYESTRIALYDGIAWVSRTVSTSPSLGSAGASVNTSYDVYAYWDGANVLLEKEATPGISTLVVRDGVHVKGNDPRRRYVGVLATNAAGNFEDSAKNRLVWNRSNQVRRSIRGDDATTWTLSGSNAWREVRNNASSRVKVAAGALSGGASGTFVSVEALGTCAPSSGGSNGSMFATGIGIDSTVSNSAQIAELASGVSGSFNAQGYAAYVGYLSPGMVHSISWLEIGQMGASFTCMGYFSGSPLARPGLNGWVLM